MFDCVIGEQDGGSSTLGLWYGHWGYRVHICIRSSCSSDHPVAFNIDIMDTILTHGFECLTREPRKYNIYGPDRSTLDKD